VLTIIVAPGVSRDTIRAAWRAARELRLSCRIRLEPLNPMWRFWYGTYASTTEGLHEYLVQVVPDMTLPETVEVVGHEMRHVYQMESGMLSTIYKDEAQIRPALTSWCRGEWMPERYVGPYVHRPWERDAFRWGHEFVRRQGMKHKTLFETMYPAY